MFVNLVIKNLKYHIFKITGGDDVLNEEEIDKAKELLEWIQTNQFYIDLHNEMDYHKVYDFINIILRYIKELEESNKDLDHENNRLEKIEFERDIANKIIDEMLNEYEYNDRCNLKDFCNKETENGRCIQDCKLCIRQYFEEKVRM